MTDLGAPAAQDIFTDNQRWGDLDEWNRTALDLHEQGGIHRIERDGFQPFWAVIDHQAVLDIERKPAAFTNGPEPVLQADAAIEARQLEIKTLIHMDAPDHGKYRRLTNSWFKPASVRRLQDRLDELSREAVATMEAKGGECDFAVDIALPYPLQVILKILGLPEEDFPRMMMLTQQLFGADDPDLQREPPSPEVVGQVITDFYNYFTELTAARRAGPTDDLATLIANGLIDDEPMPDLETMGYYVIVATAGHDTTSSAMAGGMHALIEHPEQLAKLQADPENLVPNAVEEIIRWTAPVRHFMRTAREDTEVLGQEIKKGDWLYLSYKAANLDPKVFEDPLRFDIERSNADRQISFGYGVHFCLGAQLARNEIRSLFSHVLPRIDTVELAGDPATMKTTFVGGHKTLPIRYTLKPAG
ncbi:MAG: cytochrome P450 [Actinomycetota bacterium]